VYIVLHGGRLHTLGIFFFLLFISTAHFMSSVFISGFILGLVGIILTRQFPEVAQAEVLEDNFLAFLVAYLLSGMVSIIVIRLNKRLFSQVDNLLTLSEQEAHEKEVEHQTLKENVDIMISRSEERRVGKE